MYKCASPIIASNRVCSWNCIYLSQNHGENSRRSRTSASVTSPPPRCTSFSFISMCNHSFKTKQILHRWRRFLSSQIPTPPQNAHLLCCLPCTRFTPRVPVRQLVQNFGAITTAWFSFAKLANYRSLWGHAALLGRRLLFCTIPPALLHSWRPPVANRPLRPDLVHISGTRKTKFPGKAAASGQRERQGYSAEQQVRLHTLPSPIFFRS